jgi:hypothetical protein
MEYVPAASVGKGPKAGRLPLRSARAATLRARLLPDNLKRETLLD